MLNTNFDVENVLVNFKINNKINKYVLLIVSSC